MPQGVMRRLSTCPMPKPYRMRKQFLSRWRPRVFLLGTQRQALLRAWTRLTFGSRVMGCNLAHQRACRKWERLSVVLANPLLVKTLGGEEILGRRLERSYRLAATTEQRAQVVATRAGARQAVVSLIFPLASVSLGAIAFSSGSLNLGNFLALVAYTSLLPGPVAQLATLTRELSSLANAAEEARRLLTMEEEEVQKGPFLALKRHKDLRLLVVDQVSFGYGKEVVIADASFALHEGQRVLLEGANGSGKTTLLRLIMRQYAPWSGGIMLYGLSSRELSLNEWRKRVTYIWNSPGCVPGSLLANLRLGCENLSYGETMEA